RCADDPHGLSPLLLDSLLSGGVTRPTVYQLTSPALAFAYRCADDPHGLSPLLLDSLLSGGVTRPTVYQLTSP
ncbi:hypothetical protein C9421_30200, partial [Klebsiella pneumoniae]